MSGPSYIKTFIDTIQARWNNPRRKGRLLPSMLPTAYNMGNQILQMPGFVVIRNVMIHETRVIPLDGRPHIGHAIRQKR